MLRRNSSSGFHVFGATGIAAPIPVIMTTTVNTGSLAARITGYDAPNADETPPRCGRHLIPVRRLLQIITDPVAFVGRNLVRAIAYRAGGRICV
jgi:hypothetical protein